MNKINDGLGIWGFIIYLKHLKTLQKPRKVLNRVNVVKWTNIYKTKGSSWLIEGALYALLEA